MSENSSSFGAFILLAITVIIYFLPTVIAGKRGHPNGTPIFLLNLFLGWTLIGWLAALIWSASAFTAQSTEPQEEAKSLVLAGDPCQQLEKLAGLKERGHLTQEEFEVAKAKILNG
ncbi:superinfection immunity protein [Pseudomonas soli]|uniref:superinfection immunity protein n=1 Tax=Pseudomonas soli TaxID=1306993 RepID=UPI0028A5F885|nr:superinfection immunity protein [Pseudomonas soli]